MGGTTGGGMNTSGLARLLFTFAYTCGEIAIAKVEGDVGSWSEEKDGERDAMGGWVRRKQIGRNLTDKEKGSQ